MAYKRKSEFTFIRPIMGKGANAKKQYEHISDGLVNGVVKDWQDNQVDRKSDYASPSSVMTCPRVIWLLNKGVKPLNEMTWAVKQRMMLGRLAENLFADQFKDQGILLKHWKDDPGVAVEKFEMGEGDNYMAGVPDYILQIPVHNEDPIIAVSDAKTSRSDSFGYVPMDTPEIWQDWGWYKYKIQVTAYWLLSVENKQWFEREGLPIPTDCHLFSYALDDGVVRRDIVWKPEIDDINTIKDRTVRFNKAVTSDTMPDCTCYGHHDNGEVKFCKFAVVPEGSKVGDTCCSDELINLVDKTKE